MQRPTTAAVEGHRELTGELEVLEWACEARGQRRG
jgi:hypothetical protein